MPFTHKRKALRENASSARQAKQFKLNSTDSVGEVFEAGKAKEGVQGIADAPVSPVSTPSVINKYVLPISSTPSSLLKPSRNPSYCIIIDPHTQPYRQARRRKLEASLAGTQIDDELEGNVFSDCESDADGDTESSMQSELYAGDGSSKQLPLVDSDDCRSDYILPPLPRDAEIALEALETLIRPPRNTGSGYKLCKLDLVTRMRYEAMASCLRYYLHSSPTFIDASWDAVIGLGRGRGYAKKIRQWIRRFIASQELPQNQYGWWSHSLLEDEDVSGEIKLHLQRKGKYISAEDIVEFVNNPKTQSRLGLTKIISVRTAQRWLCCAGYRWRSEPKGQYSDGHERKDVAL